MRQFFLLTMLVAVCSCQVMPPQTEAIKNDSKAQVAASKEVEPKPENEVKESEPEASEKEVPSLFEMTSPDSHIEIEDWCKHDGKKIKVHQVVEEFEKDGAQHYFLLCETRDYDRMTIAVISRHPYVTYEMLRPGYYCYLKPFTYETKLGISKTVRVFMEEPREKELTEKEKAELEKENKGE